MNFALTIIPNGKDHVDDVYILYDVRVKGNGVVIYEKYYTDDECNYYFNEELDWIRVNSPKGTSTAESSFSAENRWS